jgi:putative multicomponent Na+:H+ antiporter subunit B
MIEDPIIIIIVALLPLSAILLVSQVNPYHALVIRGILGAIAALVYALLGGADVALTEALVGTMLSITLYAIAVRSSMCMRLGVLETDLNEKGKLPEALQSNLGKALKKHHLRLELINYFDEKELEEALMKQEIHSIFLTKNHNFLEQKLLLSDQLLEDKLDYQICTRIPRLYEILNNQMPIDLVSLNYIEVKNLNSEIVMNIK